MILNIQPNVVKNILVISKLNVSHPFPQQSIEFRQLFVFQYIGKNVGLFCLGRLFLSWGFFYLFVFVCIGLYMCLCCLDCILYCVCLYFWGGLCCLGGCVTY